MKLYQYKPINNYSLLNLIKNQIYCNVIDRVNDPFEGHLSIDVKEDLKESFLRTIGFECDKFNSQYFEKCCQSLSEANMNEFAYKYGVSSFTEHNNSIPMWGNYADNHQGICVEYETTDTVFERALKVDYPPTPYVFKVHKKEHLDLIYLIQSIMDSMYTKHYDWKYEKEWRILKKAYETVQYEPKAITGIYFGLRTSTMDIELVKNATNHLPHLKFWKAYKEIGYPDLMFREV